MLHAINYLHGMPFNIVTIITKRAEINYVLWRGDAGILFVSVAFKNILCKETDANIVYIQLLLFN